MKRILRTDKEAVGVFMMIYKIASSQVLTFAFQPQIELPNDGATLFHLNGPWPINLLK